MGLEVNKIGDAFMYDSFKFGKDSFLDNTHPVAEYFKDRISLLDTNTDILRELAAISVISSQANLLNPSMYDRAVNSFNSDGPVSEILKRDEVREVLTRPRKGNFFPYAAERRFNEGDDFHAAQ